MSSCLDLASFSTHRRARPWRRRARRPAGICRTWARPLGCQHKAEKCKNVLMMPLSFKKHEVVKNFCKILTHSCVENFQPRIVASRVDQSRIEGIKSRAPRLNKVQDLLLFRTFIRIYYFTLTAVYTADKFSNKQQILELRVRPKLCCLFSKI